MRTRWWVAAGCAAALVVGVLVTRPTDTDQLAALDLASPSPSPSVPVGPLGPQLFPRQLADRSAADLRVDLGGIGPLRLGTAIEDVIGAGWPQTYTREVAGCRRLGPLPVTGGAISGWALDDRVVSVQLENASSDGTEVDSGAGFFWGRSVERTAEPVGRSSQVVGDGVTVSSARRGDGVVTITASDLGGSGIRWAEVATAAGEACALGLAPGDVPPSSSGLPLLDLGGGLEPLERLTTTAVGTTLDQLRTTSWGPALADLTGTGCETATTADATGPAQTVWLVDGVVAGVRAAADTGDVVPPPGVDGTLSEVAPGRLARTTTISSERAGVASVLLVVEELVPSLDTMVRTRGPFVAQQLVGSTCTP